MEESYQIAKRYLRQHNVIHLATCGDAMPWVAPVFYAVHNAELVFLSAPHTRHCTHIALNPNVSGSIAEDYSDWQSIKGFQLSGQARLLDASESPAVLQSYAQKFPIAGEQAPPELAAAIKKVAWFSICITEMLFVNNARGFGSRESLNPDQVLS